MYWACSTSGCCVNAKTIGRQLVNVTGNPFDHGHVNDVGYIKDRKMTVIIQINYEDIFKSNFEMFDSNSF